MRKLLGAAGIVLVLAAASLRAQNLNLEKILEEFASLDSLYQPRPFQTRMASTCDRSGGNRDWDQFQEKSENQALLAEIKGPAVITRIFCAEPNGLLRIFIDQNQEPLVSLPARDFFAGKLPPFQKPLVGNDPAGFSYFPIPAGQGARIIIAALPGDTSPYPFGKFWQAEWMELPKDYQLQSLSLPLSQRENQSLEKLKAFLAGLEKFEAPPGLSPRLFELDLAGEERSPFLFEIPGPAVIRKMRLELFPQNPARLSELLQASELRCYWDGEDNPSISAGLGDFFGNSLELRSPPILLRRISNGGESLLPMPFAVSARCEIRNQNPVPGKARVELWLEPLAELPSPFRFHALEREQKLQPWPEKFNLSHEHDFQVLAAQGQGRYLGTILLVFNKYMLWWGEGDESFELDGRRDWVGTGTEDYFDGAYARFGKNLFAGALLENLFGKPHSGLTSAFRFHLLDPVWFSKSIRFSFEHGRTANDLDNCYRSVAYWYQTEPHLNLKTFQPGRMDLSKKTVIAEINRQTWEAIPRSQKLKLFLLWIFILAAVLFLLFFVIIRIWYRKAVR